jgi:hypothetical protein
LIQVNVAAESLWLMTLSQGEPKPLAAMEMRSILMSVLILTTAGGLTKLLLIEADNTERRFSFWLARIVGLADLILLLLFFAAFLLLGGLTLPR